MLKIWQRLCSMPFHNTKTYKFKHMTNILILGLCVGGIFTLVVFIRSLTKKKSEKSNTFIDEIKPLIDKAIDVPLMGVPKFIEKPSLTGVNFNAIDFETTNKGKGSANALGIAVVRDGEIVERRSWLINPKARVWLFIDYNGITPEMVANKPTFGEIWTEVKPYIHNQTLVAHNGYDFDFPVLEAVIDRYKITDDVYIKTIDTLPISRQVFSLYNYKLSTICTHLNIPLNHHEPESDAVACAEILLHCLREGFAKWEDVTGRIHI